MKNPSLKHHGIRNVAAVHWQLPTSALYEKIVSRGEGLIAHLGPLVVRTGAYTGRSPKDKFIVDEPSTSKKLNGGKRTRPLRWRNSISSITGSWPISRGRTSSSRIAMPGADKAIRCPSA